VARLFAKARHFNNGPVGFVKKAARLSDRVDGTTD